MTNLRFTDDAEALKAWQNQNKKFQMTDTELNIKNVWNDNKLWKGGS